MENRIRADNNVGIVAFHTGIGTFWRVRYTRQTSVDAELYVRLFSCYDINVYFECKTE